jgi:hypothetical protein
MHHHISMNQHGTKNSHQQLDSVKLKDHLSTTSQHSMIECQLVLDSSKLKDQKDLENQLTMKECHHLQDSFNSQFVNKLELKVLHALHQIQTYSLLV